MQTTEEGPHVLSPPLASTLRAVIRPGALAAAGIAVFAVLLIAAERGSRIDSFDEQVTRRVVTLRTPGLNAVAELVTIGGSEAWLAIVSVVAAGLLLLRTERMRAAFVVATMAVSAASTIVIKLLVNRPRPGALFEIGTPEANYSFPSGHTLNCTVCYGIIALMALPLLRSTAARITVGSAAGVVVLAVGLTRLYLGYHWATDVLAGWTLGLSILALSVTGATVLMHPSWARATQRPRSGPPAQLDRQQCERTGAANAPTS